MIDKWEKLKKKRDTNQVLHGQFRSLVNTFEILEDVVSKRVNDSDADVISMLMLSVEVSY